MYLVPLTLKYNINIIHVSVTLAELCLLGKNTRHSQVGYIDHRCGCLFRFTCREGFTNEKKKEVKPWSQGWLIAAGAYPGFCSMKRLEVFLLPLDGMLVHRRSLPRNFARFPQQFAGTHLYTWVERGTVRVKCLAQEHNTMSPARARTRTARSGVERTNHEATAPPTDK